MYRVVFFVLVLAASASHAATKNVKLCFKDSVTYRDSARRTLGDGVTIEDHFSNGATSQLTRGAYAVIKHGTTTKFADYLGDGLGTGDPGGACTTVFQVTSTTNVSLSWTLSSYGEVNGNFVYSRDGDASNSTVTQTGAITVCFDPVFCPSTTVNETITFTAGNARKQAMWACYVAASHAAYRHNGGLSAQSFTTRVSTSVANGNHYDKDDGFAYMIEGDCYAKFIVVHELGHRMAHLAVGVTTVDNSCSASEASCPASSGSHSMGSKEDQGCAFAEALAHFYALDVWNDHSEADAVFQYYQRRI